MGRIRIIHLARSAGFSIAETRAFVGNVARQSIPSARWQAMARRKEEELDALIAGALRMKSLLRESFQCACSTMEDCERLMAGAKRPSRAARRRRFHVKSRGD